MPTFQLTERLASLVSGTLCQAITDQLNAQVAAGDYTNLHAAITTELAMLEDHQPNDEEENFILPILFLKQLMYERIRELGADQAAIETTLDEIYKELKGSEIKKNAEEIPFPQDVVHALFAGSPLCGFSSEPAAAWPPGHTFVSVRHTDEITCPTCKERAQKIGE